MDIFFEQNVDNPRIEKHKKRTAILSVVRKILLAIGVIIMFFIIMFMVDFSTALGAAIGLAIGVFSGAPFILAFIFMGKMLRNSNTEYDYILNGGTLRVVKVVLRNKRKLMCTVRMSAVESMGRVTCDAYDRYAASKNAKKQYALCDYEDESRIVYLSYRDDGENFLLHIEPNDEMLSALRRSLPRIGIIDKSLNMPSATTKQA